MKDKVKNNGIVIGIILLTILVVTGFQSYGVKKYSRYSTDTLHYEKGTVVEVSSEDVEYKESLGIYLGRQVLQVKMTEGEDKGKTIEIINHLVNSHSVYAKKNSRLIITADRPENIEPYYTVYNYDRRVPSICGLGILVVAICAIGGVKGAKAITGLVYSMYLIVGLVIPAVYSGYSPITFSIICAALSTTVTLLLLNGQSKKTLAAILATVSGVIGSLILFIILSNILHINGSSSSEAEGLILIQQETGLQIKDVLFAGVLISSLGAIMDVGMSIVSALHEVYYRNPNLTVRELIDSGLEIGKDMIGTMTNTLILAFTGSAFVTLLVFVSYQVQFHQLLSSNYLAIEIAQGICGTFGVVITVPAASIISAYLLSKKNL